MTSANAKIPIELLEELEKGEVILFLGRGLAEELPSRRFITSDRELAEELADRFNYSGLDRSLPSVAQFYERAHGRHALLTYLRGKIESTAFPCLAIHELIVSLPVRAIITTMYDDSLERALKERRKPYDPIFGNVNLPFQSQSKLPLIYLCGRYDSPETMRITKKDLDALLETTHVRDLLKTYIRTATLMFVGFSVGESFFVDFYDKAIGEIDKYKRQSYMFTTDAAMVETLWADKTKVAPVEASAHDGLLALYNEWLGRRTRVPERPNFSLANRQPLGERHPEFKCLGAHRDDILEARFTTACQKIRGKRSITDYIAPVAKQPLASLTFNILESDFILFDLRHNSIELWVLLGVAVALNRTCFALVEERYGSILNWIKSVGYTFLIDNLEHELDIRRKERDTSRICASIIPKQGTVLIDMVEDDKKVFAEHARTSFPRLNVLAELDDRLSLESLRNELYTADLVILRTGADLSPRAGIVIGLALGAGASVILVTGANRLSREFLSSDFPFLLEVQPDLEAILCEDVSEFGKNSLKYPLLTQVLEQLDRLIDNDKLEIAWAICEDLSRTFPSFAAIYERRAQIYKACGQSDWFRHQLLLANDLDPSSSAVKQYQNYEIQRVEQALQNQEIAKSLLMIESLLQQGVLDPGQSERLEQLLLQITEVAQETKNPETIGKIVSIVNDHGSLLERLTSKLEDVKNSISAMASKFGFVSKQSAEEETSEQVVISEDYWEKLEQLLASYLTQDDVSGIKLLTDQRARLQVELKNAQRDLQDLPRLRRQVLEYSRTIQDMENTITEVEAEIAETRNELEDSQKRVSAILEARDNLFEEKRELGRQVDNLAKTLRATIVCGTLAVAGLLLALTLTADELHWWGFVVACLPLLLGSTWWWRNQPFSRVDSNAKTRNHRYSSGLSRPRSRSRQQTTRPKPPSRRL